MDRCTVAGNEAGIEEISRPPGPYLYRTIIACNSRGAGGCAEVFCCDIYGNQEGDWVGCIAGQYGVNGNFSACPSFCSMDAWDFRLCNESPCLPGNHPDGYDCGLIGALGEGCACGPTETEPTTWSGIKAVYR
jgi:hypothetical protein